MKEVNRKGPWLEGRRENNLTQTPALKRDGKQLHSPEFHVHAFLYSPVPSLLALEL